MLFIKRFILPSGNSGQYPIPVISTVTKFISLLTVSAVLLVVIVLFPQLARGQAPANYKPPTPAAAQFQKYINYPVDHSTGAAGIEVPLYNFKAGEIQLPVSLSYHTAGVKPTDPFIPIGLGWTINPGGRVTRQTIGWPDDGYPKPPTAALSNNVQYLENREWFDPAHPIASSNRDSTLDPDYDIFTYYTGTGLSGKFIIQKQGSGYIAKPLIGTKDRIILYTAPGSPNIAYIEITDENGVFYRFGQGLTSYSTHTTESSNTGLGLTGWMLTDIVSATKADTVSLNWTSVTNNTASYYKQSDYQDQVILTDQFNQYGPFIVPTDPSNQALGYKENAQFSSVLSESYYIMNSIAGIRWKDQEARLTYTTGIPTLLTSMSVYSGGTKFREVDFYKSLFTNGQTRLDSLSFIDNTARTVNSYHFGYNQTIQLPAGPSRAIDFWGYYNGQSNTTLVPNFSYQLNYLNSPPYSQSFTSTIRDPNANAQAYILNTVTYPTGGQTTYEYEANKISVSGGSQVVVGGLRVSRINHWTSAGQLAESHSFVYGINESGAGDGVVMDPNMFVSTTETCSCAPGGSFIYTFVDYRNRVLSGYPVGSILTADFPAVTYQIVTEYIGDPAGNNIGKILYHYSPAPTYPVSTYPFSYDSYVHIERYWDRPQLLRTTYYKNSQGTYTPVSSTATSYINYQTDAINSLFVKRFANFTDPYNTYNTGSGGVAIWESNFTHYYPNLGSVFSFGASNLYSGGMAPDVTTQVEYLPTGDSVVLKKSYGYTGTDYLYTRSITTQNSNGTTSISHFTYPKDYTTGSSPTDNVAKGIKKLMDNNVVAPVIEEYTERQPSGVLVSGNYTTYKTDTPLPDSILMLSNKALIGSFAPASVSSSTHGRSGLYIPKGRFDLYDSFGNPRQVTERINGTATVFLYSYNGRFPICSIQNTTYAAVAAILGDSNINSFAGTTPTNAQIIAFLAPLRSSPIAGAQMTSYTSDPLVGVTSITDPKGMTNYYEYDSYQRLQNIKDKDGNIIKSFCYNYKGQPTNCNVVTQTFTSALTQNTFQKSCGTGYTGSFVTYTVPAGTYTSTISQADANNKAQNDVTANGQNYANANGTCLQNFNFVVSNSAGAIGMHITFSGTNGTYTFLVSSSGGIFQVPIGIYQLDVGPDQSYHPHHILLGTTPTSPAYNPSGSFYSVNIASGGDLNLYINN